MGAAREIQHSPESAPFPEHSTGHSWSDIASDIWSGVKRESSRLMNGTASLGEYGAAISEVGALVALGSVLAPVELGIGTVGLVAGLGTAAVGEVAMFTDLIENR